MRDRILKRATMLLLITFVFNFVTPLYAAPITLPAGTPVSIQISQTVTSDMATFGTPVNLIVASDVMKDGQVVIKGGAPAYGTVTNVQKAGMLGKPGEIGIQVTHVTAVDGSKISVTATMLNKGQDKQTTSIVIGLFLCFFALAMKGGEGSLQAGNIIQASTLTEAIITVD